MRLISLVTACLLATGPTLAVALASNNITAPAITVADVQRCPAVVELSKIVDAHEAAHGVGQGALMTRAFTLLFPFENPAWNALTATFYISFWPNVFLAVIPSEIELSSLNTMIAFSTGAILGDTFMNLLPHSFFGDGGEGEGVPLLFVDKRRNIVVGATVFSGFFLFFMIDKTMRYVSSLTEEDGVAPSSHSHSHSHSHGASSAIAAPSPAGTASTLRNRSKATDPAAPAEDKADGPTEEEAVKTPGKSLQLGAYLNLFSDTLHNATDGLSLAAAFYASPLLGATTTLATFLHEVPHEMADFSILVKSGFTKRQAMASQFVTAVGAVIGTLLGIFIQRLSLAASASGPASASAAAAASSGPSAADLTLSLVGRAPGLLGTSLAAGELVIPAVAGSFLYIASVSVVPELLEESRRGRQIVREGVAMAFGLGCMAVIAWNTDE